MKPHEILLKFREIPVESHEIPLKSPLNSDQNPMPIAYPQFCQENIIAGSDHHPILIARIYLNLTVQRGKRIFWRNFHGWRSLSQMRTMVLEYLPTKLGDFSGKCR